MKIYIEKLYELHSDIMITQTPLLTIIKRAHRILQFSDQDGHSDTHIACGNQ